MMNEEIQNRLDEFMKSMKPDSTAYLHNFKEEILYLYHHGYSYKLVHKYLTINGVGCAYSTFIKWARENITPLVNIAAPSLQRLPLETSTETNTTSEDATSSAVTNSDDNELLKKETNGCFAPAKQFDSKTISNDAVSNTENKQTPEEKNESFAGAKLLIEKENVIDESSIDPKEAFARKLAESKARLEASLGKSPKQLISEAKKL